MTSSHNEPQPRPEVVQALFSALVDMDPGELAKIAETGITPAERSQERTCSPPASKPASPGGSGSPRR